MFKARYDPANEVQEFSKGFENFNSFLDNFIDKGRNVLNSDFTPSVNTRDEKDAYHVEIALPGVRKEDINIDIKDHVVTISCERKKEIK